MSGRDCEENVEVLFFSMNIPKDGEQAIKILVELFDGINNTNKYFKSKDIPCEKPCKENERCKEIWIDLPTEKKENGFDVTFKSAKCNHGCGKTETTRLCIRLLENGWIIAVLERNYYGIEIDDVATYLKDKFDVNYNVSFKSIPSECALKNYVRNEKIVLFGLDVKFDDFGKNNEYERSAMGWRSASPDVTARLNNVSVRKEYELQRLIKGYFDKKDIKFHKITVDTNNRLINKLSMQMKEVVMKDKFFEKIDYIIKNGYVFGIRGK
jgi:hypothetical protein